MQFSEETLSSMREIRECSERHLAEARKLIAPPGWIAVGGGEFDEWIIGESLAVLLGEFELSGFPLDAEKSARTFARNAIKIHNSRRPKDINWQRWEGHADWHIESARRQLERTHPF